MQRVFKVFKCLLCPGPEIDTPEFEIPGAFKIHMHNEHPAESDTLTWKCVNAVHLDGSGWSQASRRWALPDGRAVAAYRIETVTAKFCKSCGREIVWGTTEAGKRCPYDADECGHATAVSHFTTCPNAKQHSKPRQAALL